MRVAAARRQVLFASLALAQAQPLAQPQVLALALCCSIARTQLFHKGQPSMGSPESSRLQRSSCWQVLTARGIFFDYVASFASIFFHNGWCGFGMRVVATSTQHRRRRQPTAKQPP